MRILCVCLGNICRSPVAEAVMKKLISDRGLSNNFFIDSAGTSGFHEGEPADSRSIESGQRHGLIVDSISRPFKEKDFETFDYILVMDDSNLSNIKKLDRNHEFAHKIFKITDFRQKMNYDFVPDPYYAGRDGFELVIDILLDACDGFLKEKAL